MKPAFLITIDTEGDNLWARPQTVKTANAGFLSRFQALCERHGLKPTYLANWEMATSPAFQDFGKDVLARGQGEIGMHLHAWNSPPIVPLTDDDARHHPYLIEYPESQIRQKIKAMTDVLEQVFAVKMVSHRAGRWAFDETYARILVEHGYRVDCSVTPHISWAGYMGHPGGHGGSDYTAFPQAPYFVDLDDIARPGRSPLLEAPLTVLAPRYPLPVRYAKALMGLGGSMGWRAANHFYPGTVRCVPNGKNRVHLLRLLTTALFEKRDCVELAFHSSELMPGGSPTFSTASSIEDLYQDLDAVFSAAAESFIGVTLEEYHRRVSLASGVCGSNNA